MSDPTDNPDSIVLDKECRAFLVPFKRAVILSKGTAVKLLRKSREAVVVSGLFGVAEIFPEDAARVFGNFLGELFDAPSRAQVAGVSSAVASSPDSSLPPTSEVADALLPDESELWEAAKSVFDPEIPVNIADLGLVYRLEIKKTDDGKNIVEADMSLTAPGCAMGPSIAEDLRLRLSAIPWVSEAKVNIVWDPPWNPDMMSEEARMILGLA